MNMKPVESSNLAEVGYDPATMTLRIRFHSGGVYEYFDVPESVYCGLMQAESHGKFFHAHIRNSYRYAKL